MQTAAKPLDFGEPAPWFTACCGANLAFNFDTMGGFWVVLMLFGSLSHPEANKAHDLVLTSRDLFDDKRAMFFGVTVDHTARGLRNQPPGLRYFQDYDRQVSKAFGAVSGDAFTPYVVLLDPTLRAVVSRPIRDTGAVLAALADIVQDPGPAASQDAPVLLVPRVFEPELCSDLIRRYNAVGGSPSGFMRAIDGKTMRVHDPSFKRRQDWEIDSPELIDGIQARLASRLLPMVQRAFGYRPGYVERHLIACYTEQDRGFFRAHRDTTTPGTRHRQLAVTINLNADDYEGGELSFPEFSPRLHKPATGGAAVFGGALLHEVKTVARGRRLAYLPFLYDAASAALRARNSHTIVDQATEATAPGA